MSGEIDKLQIIQNFDNMKSKVFLNAARNLNDCVNEENRGHASYICHALCEELDLPSDASLPFEYERIVELFKPTEEEHLKFFKDDPHGYLWYGYFGRPDPFHQPERVLACLFMYQIALDIGNSKS